MNVIVFNHIDFDNFCAQQSLNDNNVENNNYAFISIIGTQEIIEDYLGEYDTKHHFNENHSNVLNLEFDDVSEDREFEYETLDGKNKVLHAKAISEGQAKECVDFIENNVGKTFIIHCRAGRSRSQAFFRFITDFYEEYNDCEGNKDNPCHSPNIDVLAKLKRAFYTKHGIYKEQ